MFDEVVRVFPLRLIRMFLRRLTIFGAMLLGIRLRLRLANGLRWWYCWG